MTADVCVRCFERPVQKARRLCRRCYGMCQKKGILRLYPLATGEQSSKKLNTLVCACDRPTRQRVPWFENTYQCGRCGRPFANDLARDRAQVPKEATQ